MFPNVGGLVVWSYVIALYGHNMAETQSVLWSRVLDRLAGPNPPAVVCVDPRRTPVAEAATVHLAPRPGTNVVLMNALILLAAPACTAGSIGLDKARRTLLHMLITDLSDTEIILGKLAAQLLAIFRGHEALLEVDSRAGSI